MDFATAKQQLRENYVTAGLEVVEDDDKQVILRHCGKLFVITEADIRDYANTESLRIEATVAPVECGLCSATYREQVVQPLDPTRWRHLPPLEMGFVFGAPDADEPYVTIGAPSDEFLNFFRFDPTYLKICLERMERAPDVQKPLDIRQGFYRLPTVQAHNLNESNVDDAIKRAQQLIEYCFFELSYLRNLPVGFAEEWPARRRDGTDMFHYQENAADNLLPMPPAEFNPDIVGFYQLGVSSRIPVLQFWSFYQVIEYFFVRASDESLHQSLSNRLKDPRFKPSSAQLDRIIQDVADHINTIDETAMLEAVLGKYVDRTELIEFILQYEEYRDEPLYTKRRRLFGEDIEIKMDKDTVIENVARTIHAIRSTLMFSSDRFSRTARSVPFNRISETVKPEIPLMKFLAERIIIGSAQ